jgi:hypothetical protein
VNLGLFGTKLVLSTIAGGLALRADAIHFRYAVALANYQGGRSEHFGESPYLASVDMDIKEKRVKRQELVANLHLVLSRAEI